MSKITWQNKLYAFAILIALLPLGISSFNMIADTEQEIKSNVDATLISSTNTIADRINKIYRNDWLSPLLFVKSGLEIEELDAQQKALLLARANETAENILSMDLVFEISEGELIKAVGTRNEDFTQSLQEKNIPESSFYQHNSSEILELVKQNKNIGTPFNVPKLDEWLITMILPVNIEGSPPAYLIANLSLNNLKSFIEAEAQSGNKKILLINSSGQEVFDHEKKDLSSEPEVKAAVDNLISGRRDQVVAVFEKGEEKIAVCTGYPENLDWAIIVEIDENKAYSLVADMENKLILWVGLGIVIAFVSVFILSSGIRKPIIKISKVAEVISGGNFDVAVDYKANDEIGLLGKTLVNMASSLRASFAKIAKQNKELEEYNRTLEDKVEQRTIELKEKNTKLEETLDELKRTQDQLIVQQKLASLGALTAGIAHEIQNPLNFVNNFGRLTEKLIDELHEEVDNFKDSIDEETNEIILEIMEDIKTNAKKINEYGTRADEIVKGMLQHSRGDTGEMRAVNINDLLKETLNLAYHGLKSESSEFNLEMENNFDESIKEINVNPQALQRVFLNIINNGFYATLQKKKTSSGEYEPLFVTSTKILNNNVEIKLRDNGTGIPKDVVDKIFEPFFTTKPTGEGTGLGLSLSYDIIVQLHNGNIKVNTKEGEYTEFIITLPVDK